MATPFKVWSTFSVIKETSSVKFRTIEPPPERIDDVVELVCNYFTKEEALCKAAGIPQNEEAMEVYKDSLTKSLKKGIIHTVVCCLDNDNDEIGEIIGGSFMSLTNRDTPYDIKFQAKTKELQKMYELISALLEMYDIMGEQKVDKYYHGRGVVVQSKYRGLGITKQLLRTRRLICIEHGVPLTVGLMTAYGSQKAAERDSWKNIFELNFEDFGKKHGVTFEGSPTIVKLMAARTPLTQ